MSERNPKNERLKRDYVEYLLHAEGKSEPTIRQIEKAILRYEEFTGFADFRTFNQQKAMAFKAHLANQSLAKATILSVVTDMKRFFGWLAGQAGFKSKIALGDIEFLSLSEKDVRAAKAPSERAYPSLAQIERVVSQMPSDTPLQKRNRALIAFTALTGIRDGAVISLRLKHVDIDRRLVTQHPRDVATKFGKRIDTFFFPVGERFEEIIFDWIRFLQTDLLFGPDEPLFPKTAMGHDQNDCFVADNLSRAFWANTGPVREIFKSAFNATGLPTYTPHSFRNTLVQLAYRYCKTPEEFKAWSQNLGHESPLTTFTSYGKIEVHRQGELVRQTTQERAEKPLTRKELEEILSERGVGTEGS